MNRPANQRASAGLRWRQPALVLIALALFYTGIQAATDKLPGYDGLFHIKYAYLLGQGHSPWEFHWLQASIYRQAWVDHSFLFHCLLIPFTWLSDLHLAAKAAGVALATSAVFAFYLLIRGLMKDVPRLHRHAWIWPLIILASSDIIHFRLSMVKVPPLAVTGLAVALAVMFARRFRWLVLVAAAFAWTYHGAVILVPVSMAFCAAIWLSERRLEWRPLAWVLVGLLLGLTVNPFFPDTFAFAYDHLVRFTLRPTPVLMPAEFTPYAPGLFVSAAFGAFIATGVAVVAVVALWRVRRRPSLEAWCLLLLNILFFALYLKARRFVEYWPLFSVAFAAVSVRDLVVHLGQPAGKSAAARPPQGRWARVAAGAMVVLCGGLALHNGAAAAQEIDKHMPDAIFQGAARWLATHTPPGTVVYNAEWNHFPHLFFYNHHNHWTMGLNETFTYFLDPGLWAVTTSIRWGKAGEVEDVARLLKRHFGAQYAVGIKDGKGLALHAADALNGLKPVYEDKSVVVYHLEPNERRIVVEAELNPTLVDDGGGAMTCMPVYDGWSKSRAGPLSFNAALGCRGAGMSGKLGWRFDVPKSGRWSVRIRYLLPWSPGQVWVGMDRQPLGKLPLAAGSKFFRDSGVHATVELNKGEHEVGLLVVFPKGHAEAEIVVDNVVLEWVG